jgi:hypothetical protein
MYNIDWHQLSEASLPGFLRKTKFKDYLKACLKPFIYVYNIFIATRKKILFELRHTGQVIYLEHMLNAVFNYGLPAYTSGTPTGIYLGPGSVELDSQFIFTKIEIETEDKWVYEKTETPPDDHFVWIYTKEELNNLDYDFSIYVPIAIGDVTTNQTLYNQIASWVNKYRQAGKRFKILNYTP